MIFLWPTSDGTSGNKSWFDKNGWIILLVISIILVIAFVCALVFSIRTKRNELKEGKIDEPNKYIDAFGGKENIISSEAKGSRLVVVLKDYSLMSEDKLKELGIESLIKATDKVTFIVGEKAEAISKELNK